MGIDMIPIVGAIHISVRGWAPSRGVWCEGVGRAMKGERHGERCEAGLPRRSAELVWGAGCAE